MYRVSSDHTIPSTHKRVTTVGSNGFEHGMLSVRPEHSTKIASNYYYLVISYVLYWLLADVSSIKPAAVVYTLYPINSIQPSDGCVQIVFLVTTGLQHFSEMNPELKLPSPFQAEYFPIVYYR